MWLMDSNHPQYGYTMIILQDALTIFQALGSLAFQLLFGCKLLGVIATDEYEGKYAAGIFEKWGAVKTPLVTGACSHEQWTWEENMVDEMEKYTTKWLGVQQGLLFGAIALFLWCTAVAKEIRLVIDFAMFALPITCNVKNKKSVEVLAAADPDTKAPVPGRDPATGAIVPPVVVEGEQLPATEHETFHMCKYKVIIVAIALLRLAVALLVGWYGSVFLCHTDNLKDFVLNTLALAFVYEIDDLVFNA